MTTPVYHADPYLLPGAHPRIPSAVYHADPCVKPSLSSTYARHLLTRSPAWVWRRHPRLGGIPDRNQPTPAMKIGSAVHAMMFGSGDEIVRVEAADYRTAAARDQRDEAIGFGSTPLLSHEYDEVRARVAALLAAGVMPKIAPELIGDDQELTAVWTEADAYFRARFDMIDRAKHRIYDLKCTNLAAHSDGWARTEMWSRYPIQVGHYRAGYKAVFGETPEFIFIVQEGSPPYDVRRITYDEAGYEYCDQIAADVRLQWAQLMARSDPWPAAPRDLLIAETPSWVLAQIESRYDDMEIDT